MDSLNFNSVETLLGYKPKEASLWFVHALYSAYPNKSIAIYTEWFHIMKKTVLCQCCKYLNISD